MGSAPLKAGWMKTFVRLFVIFSHLVWFLLLLFWCSSRSSIACWKFLTVQWDSLRLENGWLVHFLSLSMSFFKIRNTDNCPVSWLAHVMHLSVFVDACSLRLVWCVAAKSPLQSIPFSVNTNQSRRASQCHSGVGCFLVRKLWGNFVWQQQII